jgi:hypothetical protein
VKIISLQLENVKRVKALRLEPTANGLTVIGGKNRQGKTTALDAIAWAVGGANFAPTDPQRDGAPTPPIIDVTMDNGIRVTRKGKNSALTVTDIKGQKAGQALIDEFVSPFAINLPKFLNASAKEKAAILLKTLGVGDKLSDLDAEEKRLYDERTAAGRLAESKRQYADALPCFADAPADIVSVADLVSQHKAVCERNQGRATLRSEAARLEQLEAQHKQRVKELQAQLDAATEQLERVRQKLDEAKIVANAAIDEDASEIEARIQGAEAANNKVSANVAKKKAVGEAETFEAEYKSLTERIEGVRSDRVALLEGANLPYPGLSFEGGELLLNDKPWDGMSGSEQLIVGAAIARKENPNCGFVLIDKLEQLDTDTMKEFGAWAEKENLQVIATRVTANKNECTIIIEDGEVSPEEKGSINE